MVGISLGQLATLLSRASTNVDPEVSRNLRALAQVGTGSVKSAIQAYHAVDTSTMLNSTRAEAVGTHTYLIGPTTDYAVFVALGTSRMAARPFHVKAANDLRGKVGSFGFSASALGI